MVAHTVRCVEWKLRLAGQDRRACQFGVVVLKRSASTNQTAPVFGNALPEGVLVAPGCGVGVLVGLEPVRPYAVSSSAVMIGRWVDSIPASEPWPPRRATFDGLSRAAATLVVVSIEDRQLRYFAPDSVSWQVHREVTVLLGGLRALLMQAIHPLVIAGAKETGFYERNPWKRLERTLRLTYTITFGTKDKAAAAAARINDVHTRVNGIDPETGLTYDALDPQLLLWVHACLLDCALLFERHTVGKLDDADRERFYQEQLLVAEMIRLPRELMPATLAGMYSYMDDVMGSGILRMTEGAEAVADILTHWPEEAEWKPVLKAASWWGFGTLPPPIRDLYGVKWNPAKEAALRANLLLVKATRPLLPAKFRFIEPYNGYMRGDPEWRG